MLVGCATAASLFPFVGTIVYMILRPPEYLEDVRERELEMQAAEARLHELDHGLCPHCDYRVERDFIRCPSCLRKLKERCVELLAPAGPGVDDLPLLRDRGSRSRASRRPRRRRASAESEALAIESDGLEGGRSARKSSEDWLGDTAASAAVRGWWETARTRGAAAGPIAASKPTSRSRSAGRASRPRPTS